METSFLGTSSIIELIFYSPKSGNKTVKFFGTILMVCGGTGITPAF